MGGIELKYKVGNVYVVLVFFVLVVVFVVVVLVVVLGVVVEAHENDQIEMNYKVGQVEAWKIMKMRYCHSSSPGWGRERSRGLGTFGPGAKGRASSLGPREGAFASRVAFALAVYAYIFKQYICFSQLA